MKPVVAIVGRPNVGKSTLFNKIVGERASIVDNVPGVTRDRLYRDAEWLGKEFLLVDTGGLEPESKDFILSKVKDQAQIAMREADVIVFVVDGHAGVTALDQDVATVLRNHDKPVIIAVNKIDDAVKHAELVYEFYGFGFDNVIPVSAEHTKNIGDLLDAVIENLRDFQEIEEEEGLKIAVVGKPNAGKSSLINRMLGEERTIVSDIAGTTRDAIDSSFEYKGSKYVLIDTAGIRRRSKVDEDLEYYSVLRAMKAIKRADVVYIVFDAEEGLTEQDKRIAGMAHEERKPVVITVNKWDKIDKDSMSAKEYEEALRQELQFMSYAPILFVSALTGQRVMSLIDMSNKIYEEYTRRITTGLLNQVIKEALMLNPPPTRKGRAININYATQIETAPPRFVIFANHPELVHFSYIRYIENKLREAFGFEGAPIEIEVRRKGE